MKRRSRAILIGTLLLLVVAAIFGVKYLLDVQAYRNQVSEISFQHDDAAGLPDGVYEGAYDVGFIYARVRVEVRDGAFAKIELLEHRHDRGAAAEGIEQRILAEQKLDVDTVSGATNSSQVIKKAVDNALTASAGLSFS